MSSQPFYAEPAMEIVFNYDQKPELIKRTGANYVQFTYDGNGQRIKKENLSTGNAIFYFGELYEVRAGAGTIHLFANNKRVASVFLDGTTQFYHPNHLGSASVITDQNGNRKEQIEYYPYGTYRAPGDIHGTYDFDASFPDVFYTFTGQEDDDDLGLYNYGARLYDPLLGRFISPDSIVPDPQKPQSMNRYSYCLNNPLRYTDPTGHANADEGLGEGINTGWGQGNPDTSTDSFMEGFAQSNWGAHTIGWNVGGAPSAPGKTFSEEYATYFKEKYGFAPAPQIAATQLYDFIASSRVQVAQVSIDPNDIVFDLTTGWREKSPSRTPEVEERIEIQRAEERAQREAIRNKAAEVTLEVGLAIGAELYGLGVWGAIAVHEVFDLVFPHETEEKERGGK